MYVVILNHLFALISSKPLFSSSLILIRNIPCDIMLLEMHFESDPFRFSETIYHYLPKRNKVRKI